MTQRKVPYELHAGARIVFVGRDPGAQEEAAMRPFIGPAGQTLMDAISAAGHKRTDASYLNVVQVRPRNNEFSAHAAEDVALGVETLQATLRRLQPNLVVALGNEAAWACVADWPSRHGRGIMAAADIERRRGYLWEGRHGGKVLTTLHPSAVMRDASGISEMLFTHDIERAFKEAEHARLVRPQRRVVIVDSVAGVAAAVIAIKAAPLVACDIEITEGPEHRCACVGFAVSTSVAYVFTPATLRYAFELLESPELRTVWQNGQFDLHFLLTRHDVRVAGPIDDTIVAWHALWPELAGKAQDKASGERKRGGAKRTHKGLAFLASLYSNVAWWKNYDFETERQKWHLNGLDCCLTLEVFEALQAELRDRGVYGAYVMTMGRIWPVVTMQARGLLVDESVRAHNLDALRRRRDTSIAELRSLAEPALVEARNAGKLSKPHLIWHRSVCTCCRNGKAKREACFECEGFEAMPKKPELLALAKRNIQRSNAEVRVKVAELERLPKLKKAELIALALRPCRACEGRGEHESYEFNPASDEQLGMLLFEALKLPPRAGVDEASLKSLLGVLSAYAS